MNNKKSLFRKNKKGLLGETITIAIVLILLILIIIIFYAFFTIDKSEVEKTEQEIGDNLFLVGLLQSQVNFEDNTVSLSELISMYKISLGNDRYSKAIISHVNQIMKESYSKDVCWVMTVPSTIETNITDCAELSKEEDITAKVVVAGFDGKSFEVGFETKK